MEKNFVTQFSFTADTQTGMESLQTLRAQLAELKGKPLMEVYNAFGIVPTASISSADYLNKVDIVRKTASTKNSEAYGYFIVSTATHGTPHVGLWIEIAKSMTPHIRVDYISNSDKGNKLCGALYIPGLSDCASELMR